MARTIEEIDAEIERLMRERQQAFAAPFIALIPADAGPRLLELAHEAASRVSGKFDMSASEEWVLSPGVRLWVTFDTAIEDEAESA